MPGFGATALQRRHHARSTADSVKTGISTLLAGVMAVYFLLPLYWLLVSTTKNTNQLHTSNMFVPPAHWHLASNWHWLVTYQQGVFFRWFLNSIIYAGITATLSTFVCAMAGYALAKYDFRMRGSILRLVVGALAVPSATLVIPLFLIVKALGLINSYAGVILPMLVNPFGVYFLSVYIRDAMPSELIDSGRVDGASDWRIFTRIALAIIRPGLVTLFLIAFIGVWNNFFLPLVLLNQTNLYPVVLGLEIWVANLNAAGTGIPLYPLIILGSFLSVFPMVVLFPFLRKYIISGITMGGLKS